MDKKRLETINNALIKEINAYHATNASFNQFDPDNFALSGNGNESHGHGVYLGDTKENVDMYGKIILTVDIPNPDSSHYLFSDKQPSKTIRNKVKNALFKRLSKEIYKGTEYELWNQELSCLDDIDDGELLYGTVCSFLGSDVETSRFLDSIGIYGIVLNFKRSDNGQPYTNFLIFNPEKAQILKRENN